ncbi:MAG: restriction endonuclease subunit S, partial [Nitrosomonas sp.]
MGEIAEIQTGPFGSQLKNEQYITGGTPVVTVEHISNFRINNFSYPSVTDEDKNRLSKYLLNEGDIIFTRVGSVDLSAFVKPHQQGWMFSSRMLRVRPDEKVDARFLSYFFQQKPFRDYVLSIAVGATMPSINTEILKSLPVSYPELSEQKAIASVLSSLDDKIDLLHRQNKTLEAMAETLFRQWFVEEAGEDWEERPLSFFGEIICGKTPSKKSHELFGGDIPFIKIPDMHNNVFLFKTEDSLTEEGKMTQANKTLPGKTICVSCIATVGLVSITTR